MKIAYIGMSHLGIISSICTAEKGLEVICYDEDINVIEALRSDDLIFSEPKLDDLYIKNKSKIYFTNKIKDITDCNIIYISHDIPTDNEGNSDLKKIQSLIHKVIKHINEKAIIVILSQVPPGFTRSITFDMSRIFYQVETLIFGNAVERALFPERFIVGSENNVISDFYYEYLKEYNCPIFILKYESAELSKIAINMFLVSSITTTNVISELCEKTKADWDEISPVLKLDKRIGNYAYLKPGLGIAGGNLQRDLISFKKLAKEKNTQYEIIQTWLNNSEHRSKWAYDKFKETFLIKDRKNIGILGLSYKENTASIKNSPALKLISLLKTCNICAYDPVVKKLSDEFNFINICKSMKDVYQDCDILFIMTPWQEFRKLNSNDISVLLKEKTIFDPYGVLDKEICEINNLNYYKLGV